MVPTGLSSVPPLGPAIPVIDTAISAPATRSAPSAIAAAVSALTAPCARQNLLAHAEHRLLGAVRVNDGVEQQVVRGPGHSSEHLTNPPAGAGFGHGQRLALIAKGPAHRFGKRIRAASEHGVAEKRAHLVGDRFGTPLGFRRRVGAHVNLHLDFGKVGAIAERQAFVLFLESSKRLRDTGFRHPEGADVHLMGSGFGKRGNRGKDRFVKDVLHLARHPWNEEEPRLSEAQGKTWGGADRIRENLRALREVALLRVGFGHHPTERFELLSNAFDDAFVAAKLDPCGRRCRHGGEIIGRWTEPACDDDDSVRFCKASNERHDSLEPIVDGGVLDDVESELGQLFAEPCGVCIYQLTTGELGANR